MCARLHAAPRASAALAPPLAARWRGSVAALLLAALALSPQSAAQDDGCGGLLCTPSVTFEPSVAAGNAFGGPRVRDLATGAAIGTRME